MSAGRKAKLKRIEKKLNKKQRVNRLALEYECDHTGAPASPQIAKWLSTPYPRKENPPAALLCGLDGILNRRVILFPRFRSESEWELATAKQQKELLAQARSRTNEPAEVKADIVGTFEDDSPAPKRKGEKGRRFVELADGRTFDTELRHYVDEDGRPITKAGGLSVEWKR